MQRVKTTTVCDGCGREETVETEGENFQMASSPPTWANVSAGDHHGFACSATCGAKLLTRWMAPVEKKPPAPREAQPTLPDVALARGAR